MKLTFYPSTKTGIYAITFMIMAVILVVVVAYLGQDMEVEPEGSFFDHMNLAVMSAVLLSFVAVYFGTMEFIGEMNLFNLQTK